jgi:hypothetical protein
LPFLFLAFFPLLVLVLFLFSFSSAVSFI